MIKSRIIYTLVIFLTALVCTDAQVYPVSVNGSLMIPVSNRLTDLSGIDGQKLTYNVMLNDPVEASLEVYFKVIIKNNNRVIMESNPSITTVRKVLLNAQMTALTGSDLAQLININTLIGRNGFGVSNNLPKGMNSICIQAISTRNNQIVSNEGCASGLFQDLQVPVIELPKCASSIESATNQNIQFKWAPRHIGSPNAPSMVSYEIELREMPPGAISPADVFSSATLFLKRIVNTSSFLLTDTDPKLVPGKTYAWRVRVQSSMGGSYFLNNGYSEYCSFTIRKKGDITVPSCSSGSYETGIIPGVGNPSVTLQSGQKVKVGYFDLEIKEATKAGSGYNGKGLVYVPFLKANLNVTFSDLGVNSDLRAHTVGQMTAISDVEIDLTNITATSSPADIDNAITSSVAKLINTDPSKRMTMNRSTTDRTPIGAPMILGGKDSDGKSLPSLIVSRISFGPRKATVDIAMSPPSKESSTKANFWKRDVPVLPSGIPANPQLDLVSDMIIPMGDAGEIVIKLNTTESNATKARCDCEGFNTFVIQGKYKMPETFINLDDTSKPLYGSFSARSKHWGNLILELTGLEKFGLTPMQDFVFGTDKVVLDYSSTSSIAKMEAPEGYPEIKKEWLGLYLPEMRVTIPKSLTGTKDLNFTGEHILLDDKGLFAKLNGKDLLKMGDGKIGSWGFGIKEVNIDIAKSSVANSYILGGLQLPIMKGTEAMPYKATFVNNKETKKYDLKFQAVPKDIEIALLGSSISFDTTSIIDIERKDGSFTSPKVNLSGVVKFDLKPTGYVGKSAEYYANLQKLAKDNNLGDLVPVFKSEGFKFKDFIIDLSRKGNKFAIGNIEPTNSSLAFLGTTANLADVKFGEVDSTTVDKAILAKLGEGERALGFTFETKVAENVMGALAPTVSLGFNLKEKFADDGTVDYDFLSYNIAFGGPSIDMSCNNNLKPIAISNTSDYSGSLADLKEIKVGRFVLAADVSSLSKNGDGSYKGTGVIKVPVLGPMQQLSVSFDNLKVNSDKQMMDGSIVTKSDSEGLFKDPNIKGLLGTATSKLNTYANKAVSLPVILGDPKKDGYNFTFTGLEWTSTKASLSARLIVDMGNEKFAEFKAEGLNIVPGGIVGSDIILSLKDTINMKGTSLDYPIAFDGYNAEKKAGSYVLCDCDGFQSFNLSGEYAFDKKIIKNLNDKNKDVTAKFSVKTDEWNAFMAKVESIDSFEIEGLEGFKFTPGTATLDFSKKKSPKDAKFPEGYDADEKWRGLYISSLEVEVPASFTGGSKGSFKSENMLLDVNGVSSNMSGTKIVDQSSGDLGGWAFSIDTFEMNVIKNSLVDGSFKGGIVLPIMSQKKGEFMPYETSFKQMTYKDSNGKDLKDYNMDFKAVPTTAESSLLRSKITFDKKSTITVGRKDGNYQSPRVVLTGVLEVGIEAKEGELSPITKKIFANIKESAQSLGLSAKDVGDLIPGIKSKGIKFEEMVFDMNAPSGQSKFGIKDFEVGPTKIKFLGSSSPLEDVLYKVYDIDSLDIAADKLSRLKKDSSRIVGISFKSKLAEDFLGGLAPTVFFGVQLEEKPSEKEVTYMKLQEDGSRIKSKKTVEGRSFSFFDYTLKFEKPDVNLSCRNTEKKAITLGEMKDDWTAATLDSVKVGHFSVTLSKSGSFSGGKYTGMGIVDIPVLGPMRYVNVKLTNAEFDESKQFVSGDVKTEGKPIAAADTGLTGILAKAQKKLSSKVNGLELPVKLSGDLKKDGYTILFEGLEFGTKGAKVAVKAVVDLGDEKYATFGAKGLNIVPKGISGVDVRLSLEKALDLAESKYKVKLKFDPFSSVDTSGSYISCDCDGFQAFNLTGDYTFDDKFKNLEKKGKPLKAKFQIKSKTFGNFIGTLSGIDTFAVENVPGFEFALSGVSLDYSKKETISEMKTPKGYAAVDSAWQGLYVKDIFVKVPPSFTGGADGAFKSMHMVIDSNGLSANLTGEKIVDQSSGDLGGWAFSIDTFEMNIMKNNLIDGAFSGGIVLPIMSQKKGEFMPYETSFKQMTYKDSNGKDLKDYNMDFKAVPTTAESSLLRSKITFDKKSTITVGRKDGNYQSPKVVLTGVLEVGIEAKEGELSPITKKIFANIKESAQSLGLSAKDVGDLIPGIKSKGIKFEEMVFDMNAPSGQSKFGIKDFEVGPTKIKFLGSSSPLEDVLYKVYDIDSLDLAADKLSRLKKDSSRIVGISFKSKLAEDFLGGLAPTVFFGVQLEEKPSEKEVTYMKLQEDGSRKKSKKTVEGRSFSFFDYTLKFEKPDVNLSCRNTEKNEIKLGEAKTDWNHSTLDSVKVGYFTIKLEKSGSFSGGKYTGKGIVDIPVLGPMRHMNVSLTDAAFDEKKQLISGEVKTAGKTFADTNTGVVGLLSKAKEQLILGANKVSLPVVLSGDIKKDGYTIVFEGLDFSPTSAKVSVKALVKTGTAQYATFSAKGLNIVPKGINGVDVRLSLDKALDLSKSDYKVNLKFDEYSDVEKSGSYISCDCDGFQAFNLTGDYTFDDTYKNLVKKGKPVKAKFEISSKTFGNFIGKLAAVDTFEIESLPGFEFAIDGVDIDFSKKESIENMKTPKGYAAVDSAWQGMYVKDIFVKVPSSFTGGAAGSFKSVNMVIDSNGMSANLSGQKIVDVSKGSLGGWAFSIDTFEMNVMKNNLVDGAFNGGIVLPIMSQEKGESMPYETKFSQMTYKDSKGTDRKDYDVAFKAVPTTVESSLLRSKVKFNKSSTITVGRKDGNFLLPKVNLSGVLTVGIEAKEGDLNPVAREIFNTIKSSAKDLGLKDDEIKSLIPGLKSKGINFTDLVIDMNAPKGQSKFGIKDFSVDKTSVDFLGTKSPLQDVTYNVYDLDSLKLSDEVKSQFVKDSVRVVGISFKSKLAEDFLDGLAPTVYFDLLLKETPKETEVSYMNLKDDGSREKQTKKVAGRLFAFHDYKFKFEKPDVSLSCRGANKKKFTFGAEKIWQRSDIDSVKVGHFDIALKEGSFSGGGYTGTGVVRIPVLGPMSQLKVTFTNAKFDAEKRMIAGDVITLGKTFDNGDTGLKGLMASAKSKLTEKANSIFDMPVVLAGDIEKDGYSFIFDGIRFGPEKAELTARVIVDGGGGDLVTFVGGGISVVPKGINGVDVKLGLEKDLDLSKSKFGIPLTFSKFDDKDSTSSYVACDCDGFQSFNIGGKISFPEDKLQSIKGLKDSNKKKVEASFAMTTKKWGDFMGTVALNDTVYVPGLEDLKIAMTTAEFDYSNTRNPEGFKAPEGYKEDVDEKWVGIYVPSLSIELPDALTATTSDKVASITGSGMVFDGNGFSGAFQAKNLISADKANIGGLGFSLDSIKIDFVKNGMGESKFLGGLKLPMMKDDEIIPYEGTLSIGKDANNKSVLDYKFDAKPEKVVIDMLKSEFSFDSTSVITIDRKDGKFNKPVIDLSGSFKVKIPESKDAFPEDFMKKVKELEEFLGVKDIIPSFALDSIDFKHFKLDFNSKKSVFSIGEITPRGTGVKFMTVDWKMDRIEFDDLKNLAKKAKKGAKDVANASTSDAVEQLKNLGLEFGFKYGPVGATFRVKIDEEKKGEDKVKYKFKGFAFDVQLPDAPKFTCDTTVVIKEIEDKSNAGVKEGDMVTVGRYKMKVKEASGTAGKGTIKIPFIGYTMNVSFENLQVNSDGQMIEGNIVTDTKSSLIPKEASKLGGKSIPFVASSDELKNHIKQAQAFMTLPISISSKLKELANLDLPEGLDVIVVGMNFNNKAASMNLVISIPSPIEDQDPYVFGVRGLDVRPDGFDLGELKLFLAKNIQF